MHVRCWAIVSNHLQIQKKHHSIHAREALSASCKERSFLFYKRKLSLGMKWVHSPNQLHPPKGQQSTLFWHTGPWQLSSCPAASSTSLGVTFTAWQRSLASWQYGFSRVISLDPAPQLCFHFLGVNAHLVHLLFKWHFPYALRRHSTVLSCYFRLFHLFLEFLYRSSFLHFLLLTFSSHQLLLFISFWKPLGLPI